MRIVVTGGSGFIGSHLCEALLAQGDEVLCLDNYLTSDDANVSHLEGHKRFRHIEHDVCLPWPDLGFAPELIYHLASPASPVDYARYSIETLRVNSEGTRNALEKATASGAKIVIASTSEVYGDPKISPQTEAYWGNVNPVGVRSCYDEAKRFSEAVAKTFERLNGTKVIIVRIFNTFGPRMRKFDGRVVPNFITQALSGQPLTVYGDGSQTRSFCYVSDMVAALIKAGRVDDAVGQVINLGNPEEMTINDLAAKIKEYFAPQSEIVYCELPEDDPMQRRPDISRAKRILGWEPLVGLEEGLRATAESFIPEDVEC